jgi:hypothetical protein
LKPTEILLDLSDLKLGRIIKKDFEEVIVDISAKVLESPGPAPKRLETKGAETLPVAPKFLESPVGPVSPKFEPKIDK